jgi:DNA-binding NarL/FixJ family response regulator
MLLRVLICEELPIVRDGLRTMLEAEPDIEVVATTESRMEALLLTRSLRPDVILTGLEPTGIDTFELVRRVAAEPLDPQPQFVVLTLDDSTRQIEQALRAGVNGLLLRDATRGELCTAVRVAARGQTALAPAIAALLVEWFRHRADATHDPAVRQRVQQLTPREREVLVLLADGLTADEVADQLTIGVATARTHLYRLRTKLNLRDRAQLVSFAFRSGLAAVGPATPAGELWGAS